MHTLRRVDGAPPRLCGHRGASALAPENTLLAFTLAADAGLDLVELDVHLSRDGKLVAVHDGDLGRVSRRQAAVGDLTAEELAGVDLGRGQGIPTLTAVLELARACGIGLYVELKGARTGSVLGALVRSGAADGVEVIVGSFEPALVAEARAAAPELPRSVLFRRTPTEEMARVCAAVGATYAHPCFRPLDTGLVAALRDARLQVVGPHTNDAAEARAFAALGLDILMSDDPGVLVPLASAVKPLKR